MKILLLGAYRFLGRAVIDAALRGGHAVTAFNRGNHPAPAAVESIAGDRRDPSALAGRTWDAVIDTSGQVPDQVAASARMLADAAHYTFVSSLSVYRDPLAPFADESAPLAEMPAGVDAQDATHVETYGARKALCEAAAEAALPGRVLHVRAGFIVGPHDVSDRFLSWFDRARPGTPLVVPGDPHAPLQMIDVADLAAWMVTCAERGITGPYNATGPRTPFAFIDVAQAVVDATGSHARLVGMPAADAVAAGLEPWTEIAYWNEPADYAIMQSKVDRAFDAGLRMRPLRETAERIAAWGATATHARRIALDPAKEARAVARFEAANA